MTVVVPTKRITKHDEKILYKASDLENKLIKSKTYQDAISAYIAECKSKNIEPTLWDFAKREAYITSGELKGINVCNYSVIYEKYVNELDERRLTSMLNYYTIEHAKSDFAKLVPSQAKILGWN